MPARGRSLFRQDSIVVTALTSSVALLFLAQPVPSGAIPQLDRVRVLQEARNAPEAELTDHNGEIFSFGHLKGRVALVLFGFTHCPDVCPLGMQRMQMLEKSGVLPKDKVAYVLISVDGERDTPDVLNAFVSKYSPDFIGITGDPGQVKPIAKSFSASFFKGHVSGNHADYLVAHSPQIFVVDTNGLNRAEFYNASLESMVAVVTALLAESKNEQ